VRSAQGCHNAAVAYGAPFISGKDSLNNEYTGIDGTRHAIPGTLLISAVGIVPDVTKTVTMDLKQAGNLLYVIGEMRDELGGSHYHDLHGLTSGTAPQPDAKAIYTMRALHRAMQAGSVRACHDCSEGGLAVALAEMCLAGRLGAAADIRDLIEGADDASADRVALFAETTGRFIVEIAPEAAPAFEAQFAGIPCRKMGMVSGGASLEMTCRTGTVQIAVAELESAWRGAMPTSPAAVGNGHHKYASPRQAPALSRTPLVLILHARGSNRDHDAAQAITLAGGEPHIVTVNELVNGARQLLDYGMLVVPGGFSFGDDLGAGTLWALALRESLGADMRRFIESGRPVLGVCNGFQALVKSGLLPGEEFEDGDLRSVTLSNNESGRFECRWVYLKPNAASPCLFTEGIDELIYCPVAHGEGRIATSAPEVLDQMETEGLVALTYVDALGGPAAYPANPNGSARGIAGLTNKAGNILGLMPHPENHIFSWQHPRWHRGEGGMSGLRLFENGLKHA
jgi:phosphoribosylformylglycinamidine synthase